MYRNSYIIIRNELYSFPRNLLSLSITSACPALLLGMSLSAPLYAAGPVSQQISGDNQQITITQDVTDSATAITITGNNNTVTVAENVSVNGKNGVFINPTNTLINNGNITSTGTRLEGRDAGVMMAGGVFENQAGASLTSASDSVYAAGFSQVINAGLITTNKASGSAIYFKKGGEYQGLAGSEITGASNGIYIVDGQDSVINNAGNIHVGNTAFTAIGNATASVVNEQGGTLASANQTSISIMNQASVDIINRGTISSGTGTAIEFAGTGSNSLTLDTGSVLNGNVVSHTADTNTLVFTGSGSEDADFVGDVSTNGMKSLTMQGSDWTLTGDINLTGSDATTLNVQQGTLSLGGHVTSRGNVQTAAGATLILDPGAELTTPLLKVDADARMASAGIITGDVNNAGTLASYNAVTPGAASHSQINGNVTNSGTLLLAGSELGNSLTISGNYQGDNGTVVINSELAGDNSLSDSLIIEGDSLGNSSLVVNNIGGMGAQTVQGLELIAVDGDSSGQFTLANRAVSGAYEYNLFQNSENGGWYLSSEPQPDPTPAPTPDPTPDPVPDPTPAPAPDPIPDTPSLFRPEVGAYLGNQIAAQQMFISKMSDRYLPGTYAVQGADSFGWVRIAARDDNSQAANGALSLETGTSMIQFGGDLVSGTVNGNGGWHAGVMAGLGDSETDSRATGNPYTAKGSVTGYSIGAYGTWFQNEAQQQGLYVDSWLQYNWFTNKVYGDKLATEHYRSEGVQASLETGYTLPFAQSETREWTLTPQAQIIYSAYDSENHTEANGTRITGGSDKGMMSRMGVRLANRSHAAPHALQAYADLNWENGKGHDALSFNGDWVSNDMPENRYQAAVGVAGNVSKHVQVWGQVGGEWGENAYHSYEGLIGIRVNW